MIFEKYQQLKTSKVNKKFQAMIKLLKRYCNPAKASYFLKFYFVFEIKLKLFFKFYF